MNNQQNPKFALLEAAEPFDYKVLNESKDPKSNLWDCTIEVPLQRLNYVNNNRRNYTTQLMRPIIQAVQPLVKERHLVGEYGHPVFEAGVMPTSEQYLRRITTISPPLMSHMITKLWIDGDYVMGHIKTLHTRYGREMTDFIVLDRGTIGFSLRSIGSVEVKDGIQVVKPEGFAFVTYDAVINPSNNIAKFNPNTTQMVSSPMMESTMAGLDTVEASNGAICINGVCALQESLHNPDVAPTAKTTLLRSQLLESLYSLK